MRRCLPVLALLASACASRPDPVVVVAPPPPAPVVAVVPMPAGASPNMRVPALLADGAYATPNRGLSPEGALWHLRGGLNVAALACRGANEAATVARYNALLGTRKAVLATAQARYQAEYKEADAKAWQVRWDDAMTRLYNYFSLSPARDGFCAAAETLLAEAETVPDAQLAAWAATRLPELDRPFTDFYRAYDAWRTQSAPRPVPMVAPPPPVVYAAAPVRVPTVASPPAPPPPVVYAAVSAPRIEVDPAIFRLP